MQIFEWSILSTAVGETFSAEVSHASVIMPVAVPILEVELKDLDLMERFASVVEEAGFQT